MREPMDKQFNQVVLTCCRLYCDDRYDVDYDGLAPSDFDALHHRIATKNRALIDGRNSEHTIYRDAEVNYAFRAWHDWTHYRLAQPFTRTGETVVCRTQQKFVRRRYGDGTIAEHACAVLWAEIVGQRLYEDRWRTFPEDQRAFVEAFLVSPQRAVGRPPSDYTVKPAYLGRDGDSAYPAVVPWALPFDLDRG